jgi:hypothetical protein
MIFIDASLLAFKVIIVVGGATVNTGKAAELTSPGESGMMTPEKEAVSWRY